MLDLNKRLYINMNQINAQRSGLAIAAGSIATLLTGCSTVTVDNAEKNIESNINTLDEKLSQGQQMTRSATAVSVKSGMYISGKSFKLTERDKLPKLFDARAAFNETDPVSFQEIIGVISTGINVRVDLSEDAINHLVELGQNGDTENSSSESAENGQTNINEIVDFAGKSLVGSQVKFTFEYEGTVESILDRVTSMANLFWRWENGKVTVFRHETKHYQFDGSLIDTSVKSSLSSAEKSGGSSSSQSVDMESKSLNAFSELEEILTSMISKDKGRFSFNQKSGTITVTDTPIVQQVVSEYIEEINGIFNTQIAIRAEVYEVVSDDNGNFGIDWELAYQGSKNLAADFASGMNPGSVPQMNLGIISPNSKFSGSKAFISALNKVNEVSLVTSASVYTTNGESVPIQVADEVSYVERFSREVDENGKSTFSVEPNSFLTGFTMNLTPRITSDGKVSMHFVVNIKDLNELREISFGEDGNEVVIESPNLTGKNFMQKVGVSSGETVMISGFERTRNEAKTSSIGTKDTWVAGGSRAGGKKKVVTMIMLTPYVMKK
jgi:type IVB pilus formation R64 PilN family outer membrane protein